MESDEEMAAPALDPDMNWGAEDVPTLPIPGLVSKFRGQGRVSRLENACAAGAIASIARPMAMAEHCLHLEECSEIAEGL